MKLFYIVVFLIYSFVCFGQQITEITKLIENEMASGKVPAIAVAVIKSGKVVHLSANGYKEYDKNEKADIYTAFHIASVSKIVTGLAIFKLVELNKLDLNTNINDYLSFEVKNPHYPNDIITVGRLLNHRSGIRDNYKIYESHWNNPKGDPKIKLDDFLKSYLDAKGKLYHKKHYESEANYNSFKYSNTGVALLGLIVEKISGTSFEKFCQENIFKPLEMKNTSWFLSNLDVVNVAKTYTLNDEGNLKFLGHNGYPDYPAGQLRTSISDFSNLIVGYLNSDKTKFIISKETKNKITPSPQISHEGFYIWFLTAMGNHLYYSHEGGDTGVRTVVMIDVINKNGIVIFANAGYKLGTLLRGIEKELWSE